MQKKILRMVESVRSGLLERDEEASLGLLCVLAGEPLYIFGRPGTGKSLLAQRLLGVLSDVAVTVHSPCNLDQGTTLNTTDALLLDNLHWQDSQSLLNIKCLLDVHEIHSLVATGLAPPEDSLGNNPTMDAFVARVVLRGLEQPESIDKLLQSGPVALLPDLAESEKVSRKEWLAWMRAVDEVELGSEVLSSVRLLAGEFQRHNQSLEQGVLGWPIFISPRRWIGLARLVKAHALLNGRQKADFSDFLLLGSDLWGAGTEAELARTGFAQSMESYLKSRIQDLSEWEDRITGMGHEITRALDASNDLYKTVLFQDVPCIEFKVVMSYEHLTLYAPVEFIGSHDEFIPWKEMKKEEQRLRCNFNGSATCKIFVESNARQKGYRNTSASSSFEEYGSFTAEVVVKNHPETRERNQSRIEALRQQVQTGLEAYTASLIELKNIAQEQKMLATTPILSRAVLQRYRDSLQGLFEKYRAEAQELKLCRDQLYRE